MCKRKLTDKLIDKSSITEELKLIPGSSTDFIDRYGNVYKDYGDGKFFPKKSSINNHNGYLYIGVTMSDGKNKSHRLHTIVGKLFVENPNNYPYVCHKDDNKQNPDADNLYWGDASINGKDAYAHGLSHNDKGFDDSQSMPVTVFDKDGNKICDYGSVSIAAAELGMTKTGILYQCNHKMKTKPRKGNIFRFKEEADKDGFVL